MYFSCFDVHPSPRMLKMIPQVLLHKPKLQWVDIFVISTYEWGGLCSVRFYVHAGVG